MCEVLRDVSFSHFLFGSNEFDFLCYFEFTALNYEYMITWISFRVYDLISDEYPLLKIVMKLL